MRSIPASSAHAGFGSGLLRFLLVSAAIVAISSCRASHHNSELLFTVDLRQAEPGEVLVRMTFPAVQAAPVELKSYSRRSVLRISPLSARQGGASLQVKAGQDAQGFGRWTLDTAVSSGPVTVEYLVRPGAVEEERNSGPTGFRLGYLDRAFGLFSGSQIFLIPVSPAPPSRLRIRFLTPEDTEVVAPWSREKGKDSFVIQGTRSMKDLLGAVLGSGKFETATSPDGMFLVHVSRSLPPQARSAALSRALALRAAMASRIGCPEPYRLILVPKSPEGMLVSVPPDKSGQGLSLGEGIPSRWLVVGSAIGRACLGLDQEGFPAASPDRWFLEGLPVYLSVLHSDREGWKSRREWMEQFYYETAADRSDLRSPWKEGEDSVRRARRAALVLDRLSRERKAGGLPTVEDACGSLPHSGGKGALHRALELELRGDLRARLERWLSPAAAPFPFPDLEERDPAPPFPLPQEIPARAPRSARLNLFLGGRNLGLLEQCGCRSKQVGGFARRTSLLKRRLAGGPPSLVLELGDSVPFDSASPLLDRQKGAESDLSFALLAGSGARAGIVGFSELAYGPGFLAERVARLPHGFRLLSSNVEGEGLTLPGGMSLSFPASRVRVIGAVDPASYGLGRAMEFEDATARMHWNSPADALDRQSGRMAGEELTVVAGPLGPTSVLEIGKRFPRISLILTDDSFRFGQDPRISFSPHGGKGLSAMGMMGSTLLVVLNSESYGLVRVGLLLDRKGNIEGAELEDLPLDESVPDDPGVRALLDRHYESLAKESGLSDAPKVGSRLAGRLEADYIGEEACAACHAEEAERWRSTPHAAAFASILERRRQGVPACAACHVTGYGEPTGYRRIEDISLRHVQCESCHGPGSRHLSLPVKGTIVGVPEREDCMECHDPRHSEMNDQNFPEYWVRILHASRASGR